MIHPAIGVARVGNSPNEYFIGPQVVEPAPAPAGFYRDATGALKRQAAEFRVYGYNQSGEVVRELTADSADITWMVHVANRKAAWFQWQLAMDIPEAATVTPPLRNAGVADRDSLIINPGRKTISGRSAPPVPCSGSFTGVPVSLGELRTDAQGRLLFLGGHGVSASPSGAPIFQEAISTSFINADGWYDDTSDGPVHALVSVEGRNIPVQGAWVITAPPNYAPQLKSVRTMYDLMVDLYYQAGWLPLPATVSFTRDVYPILRRLSGLQWVNHGFSVQFGHTSPHDFLNPAVAAALAAKAPPGGYDPNAERRLQIFNNFRLANPTGGSSLHWPWIYGDAMGEPPFEGPRHNASITQTQYNILQIWAAGEFVSDWDDPSVHPVTSVDQLPVHEQPAMLDRAALEFCIADVFHPGCEMTFPMRHLTMYSEPFRIRARPEGVPWPVFGSTLTQAVVLGPNGPLQAQGPGGLTRWMGLPWQADTSYCRSGYTPSYDPFLPSFWPARVPNQVLSEADYVIMIDATRSMEDRIKAFHDRTNWNLPLSGLTEPTPDTAVQMTTMIRDFGSMGVLEVRPGVAGSALFPDTVMVASYGPAIPVADEVSAPDTVAPAVVAAAPAIPKPRVPKGANFRSDADARRSPRPMRRPRP